MSKLSQLKQEAYQAGKKRDWVKAIAVYQSILELDKTNPSVINELGDLCLKSGENHRAVKHFLGAASKYRNNGLLNNAVAIYKKILRYDPENLNAHWYLGEIRANQGLLVEGEGHAKSFLASSENVTGDIKEIFLKRCVSLMSLYPDSSDILEKLVPIFRIWNLAAETERVRCQVACCRWADGDQDAANEIIDEVLVKFPEITSYGEYARWLKLSEQPISAADDSFSDVNSLALGDAEASPVPEIPVAASPSENPIFAEQPAQPGQPLQPAVPEQPQEKPQPSADETDFSMVSPAASSSSDELDNLLAAATPADEEKDDDGCFSLDIEGPSSFDDLLSQAVDGVADKNEAKETSFATLNDIPEIDLGSPESSPPAQVQDQPMDLLAAILADDSDDLRAKETDQLATISREIGSVVGGDAQDNDPERIYEMGLVYLEMGLFEQACSSFEQAAAAPEYLVRAMEMCGITHMRAGHPDIAIDTFNKVLREPGEGSREHLGLLYHIGLAHEAADRKMEAVKMYEQIHGHDRLFGDVSKRLAQLNSQHQ